MVKESLTVKYYKSIGQCVCNGTADGYRSMPGKSNPNYNNGNALRSTYKNHPELKDLTKHVGLDNGRCRPIAMYDNNTVIEFKYVKDAAIYMINQGVSSGKIQSVQGAIVTAIKRNKKYCGYYFRYLD